jgi:hypothetical protein
MNTEEKEIYEFLKQFVGRFVTVLEVSQRAGNRNRYAQDKNWAQPILRRMELDGFVESNEMGEYRARSGETTTFRKALERPGSSDLGETTIIMLGDRSKAA